MLCQSCGHGIEPDRLDWAKQKGFTVKYCKICGDKRKAAKTQQNANSAFGIQPRTPDEEAKWEKISIGKIAHGFLIEAYKKDKPLKTAQNEAYAWTKGELEVQALIVNEKKLV